MNECLDLTESQDKFSAVDRELAMANGYTISEFVGWTRFTSPWGPKLLLSQPGHKGDVLAWKFRVEGNDSWSVGVVPEDEIDNSDYLEDKGDMVTVLENEELVVADDGDIISKPMHKKWVLVTYDIDATKATFSIAGEKTIVKQVRCDKPARLALCTFRDTEVTIVSSADGEATISELDSRKVTPAQLVGECGPLVAECLYEKYWSGAHGALPVWEAEFKEIELPKLQRRLEKFRSEGKLPANKEAFEDYCNKKLSDARS